jgi:hypothetical protein
MLFVGDDWAEDHHDVYLMNDTGDRLATRRLPEGLAGIGPWRQVISWGQDGANDSDELIRHVRSQAARPA